MPRLGKLPTRHNVNFSTVTTEEQAEIIRKFCKKEKINICAFLRETALVAIANQNKPHTEDLCLKEP